MSSGKTGLRKKECMTEAPEVWGTRAVGGIEEARVGPISTKQTLRILDIFTVSSGFEAFVDVANGGMLVFTINNFPRFRKIPFTFCEILLIVHDFSLMLLYFL